MKPTKTEMIIANLFCVFNDGGMKDTMSRFEGTEATKENRMELANELACILGNYIEEHPELKEYMPVDAQLKFAEAEVIYRIDYTTDKFRYTTVLDDMRWELLMANR